MVVQLWCSSCWGGFSPMCQTVAFAALQDKCYTTWVPLTAHPHRATGPSRLHDPVQSSEIIRMLNSAFNNIAQNPGALTEAGRMRQGSRSTAMGVVCTGQGAGCRLRTVAPPLVLCAQAA